MVDWLKVITKNCKAVGTYRKEFNPLISRLAEVMERMDDAQSRFLESGGDPVTVFANGNTGTNSYLKVYMELNSQAIKMFNELGLSPAGLKKLDDSAMKQKTKTSIGEVLASIEKEIE